MIFEETKNKLIEKISAFKKEKRRIFASSSFQTQSVPLLHLLATHCPDVNIIFLNTGYLFPETYTFKETLCKQFNLNIVDLKSSTSPHLQKGANGLLLYCSNTDYCCHLNKVVPLEKWMKPNDVWISGVRRDQSSIRKKMQEIEYNDDNIIRFHPMLDWTNKDVYDYIGKFELPKHPLESEGYISIGCVPCTYKWDAEDDKRGGRWKGQNKTECGLHTELRKK